ncbi:MAG TPA: hypothetical protein VLF39_00280 [Candidatus Saccharimonadales bacterium]|nr:hypothetical protein [Candidatus Saccharimonadales bacterium]
MKVVPTKFKPASGFSHFFHLGYLLLIPALVYILIRTQTEFVWVAFALVLLSKWRMFAVRPRYWPANIRANAIDILVSISLVIFMIYTDSPGWQFIWAVMLALWFVFLKPGSSTLKVSLQAFVGQSLALISFFMAWKAAPIAGLVLGGWLICYLAARHFLTSFEEPHAALYANYWGYFAASIMWIMGHWLRFYPNARVGLVSMPSLLLTVIGFGIGSLYYMEETDQLSLTVRREVIFMMIAIISVILVFAGWGDLTT